MKTSELIKNLSNEVAPVTTQNPISIFAKWAFFSLLYLTLMVYLFQMREDIALQLHKPLFIAEIAALLTLGITVAIAAIIMSYPDAYQKNFFTYLPLAPLAVFIVILYLQAQSSINLTAHLHGEIACFLCICIFALGPGFYLFRMLHSNATTTPRWAGSMGILASFCFGALAIRLTEQVDSMVHIILVHYVPLLFIVLLGMYLGRKLLKW